MKGELRVFTGTQRKGMTSVIVCITLDQVLISQIQPAPPFLLN